MIADVTGRVDDADAARRKYKKDLDFIKPDLESYNRQKEIALGLAAGTLSKPGAASSSSAVTMFDPSGGALQVRRLLRTSHRDSQLTWLPRWPRRACSSN